jgi:hypothetical protein
MEVMGVYGVLLTSHIEWSAYQSLGPAWLLLDTPEVPLLSGLQGSGLLGYRNAR